MKKISLKWMAALFVAIVSLSFVACGDDDEKDDNGNKGIVGTWTVSEGLSSLTFIFNSDNTGTFISKYEDPYSGTETDSESFTYSMTGTNSGVIVLKQYDSYYGKNVTNVMNFTIDGNTMILYDDDNNHIVLTKTSSTGGSSSSSITSSSSIKGTYTGVDGKDQLTLTFKSNGTGTWTAKYNDSYSGIETEHEWGQQRYPKSQSL